MIPFCIPGDGGTELSETVALPTLRDARSIETLLDADLISERDKRARTKAGMC